MSINSWACFSKCVKLDGILILRVRLIITWKRKIKTIDFCEKLENKLRHLVRCLLTLWLFQWKCFLWWLRKRNFPQKIMKDGGHLLIKMSMKWSASHHMPQLNFQLLKQTKCFSYHFPCCYQTEP